MTARVARTPVASSEASSKCLSTREETHSGEITAVPESMPARAPSERPELISDRSSSSTASGSGVSVWRSAQ
eukprot:scaffold228217_cov23-Tisochrysis_lutea.AAC.1